MKLKGVKYYKGIKIRNVNHAIATWVTLIDKEDQLPNKRNEIANFRLLARNGNNKERARNIRSNLLSNTEACNWEVISNRNKNGMKNGYAL